MSTATTAAPQASAPASAGLGLWGLGVLLAMANFLAVLDTSIANVSVPDIAGGLGASSSQGTWVITSYSVAEAITVPLTGWLAARFGAVRVFVTAVVAFGFCSALCGLAPSLGSLTAFRVLQGLAGGPLMPMSQTLLLTIFPKKQQPAALGLWAVTTLVAPIMGPILGGLLCDNLGWPAIFWVNVPIALACGPVLWRLLKKYETPTAKAKVDGVGLGLLVVFVGALQLMLDLGKDRDWFASSTVVTLAVVAAVGFVSFVIWELTEPNPIVSLRVFRHRGFSVAMVTLAIAFGAFFATNVLTPLWLQSQMGYTASWAGRVSGMIGVLAVFAAPLAANLSARTDPRRLVFFGVLGLGLVTLMRSHGTSDMSYGQIAIWLLVAGVFMPMFFLPVTGIALGSVDPEETASAAGLMNFIRTMAGAVAVSLVNTSWENASVRNQSDLAGAMTGTQSTLDTLTQSGLGGDQALAMVGHMVQGQAVMLATNQVFFACASLFIFAAAAIWLAPRPARAADPTMSH